jgi:hypothetical protein
MRAARGAQAWTGRVESILVQMHAGWTAEVWVAVQWKITHVLSPCAETQSLEERRRAMQVDDTRRERPSRLLTSANLARSSSCPRMVPGLLRSDT